MNDHILATLNAAAGRKIICIGDIMLDRYIYGDVARISPEAPVPVLLKTSEREMPGGAGNVARNVASLGGAVELLSVVGRDAAAQALSDSLSASPTIKASFITDDERPTTVKTRYVAGVQQVLRVDAEETTGLSAAAERALIEALCRAADQASVILVSDYDKGVVTDAVLQALIEIKSAAAAAIIVDPKGRDFTRYGAVTAIKPNASELALATGLPASTDREVEDALNALSDTTAAELFIVTRAAKGMSFREGDGRIAHKAGVAREVYDVSGAGDTSLAALGLGLAATGQLEPAVELAIVASGIVVGKAGTAVVTADEIIAAMQGVREGGGNTRSFDSKLAEWRQAGLTIGFTNGCFDILHPGHLSVLEESKTRCDRLIVGLNSDESVRRLKGPARPVNGQDARAQMLEALRPVDAVVIFDEDTPEALIKRLSPDLLVKGGDYTVETIVGADHVLSCGGRVHIVPIVEGHSTTNMIARAKSKETR